MTPPAPPSSLQWRDAAAALALALAVLVGAHARAVPGVVGVVDDDAIYAVTAKALAEGRGYRLVNMPGEPPQTKYPVLYPALIAPAWHAGDTVEERVAAMQAWSALLAAGALAAAFLFCVRFGVAPRGAAFAACALAVSSPNVLFYCAQTMSEMTFLATLVLALWAAEARRRAAGPSVAADVACGVAIALPLLCRAIGVVVPVALLASLVVARRPVRWVLPGIVAVALPWAAWVLAAPSAAGDAVLGYQTDYLGWWKEHGSLALPAANATKIALSTAHLAAEGAARWLYANVTSARGLLLMAGALPWIALATRIRGAGPVPLLLAAYGAAICVWPWPPDRFLVPVLPLLLAVAFAALGAAARRAGEALRAPRFAAVALACAAAALVVVTNLGTLSKYVAAGRESHYPYLALPAETVSWKHYEEAFAWLRARSAPGDVLAAGFDAMTALYTGRAVVRPYAIRPLAMYYGDDGPPLGTPDELREAVARYGARYFLLSPLPGYDVEAAFFELVYAATDAAPGDWKPVWQSREDPRFTIFELAPRRPAP